MLTPPKPGCRYDRFEPEQYTCTSVDDVEIEPLMTQFAQIPCYWHTLDCPEMGLAYCGITLIPPESLSAFRAVFSGLSTMPMQALDFFFARAEREHCFIIHFGL